jgi:hypothetical protein
LTIIRPPAPLPSVSLRDPVPDTILVPQLLGATAQNFDDFAVRGRMVKGVAADGAAEVVLRIPADVPGEQFQVTVLDDSGVPSVSPSENGSLRQLRPQSPANASITVTAVRTQSGPMAFAIYQSPVDFSRVPVDRDSGKAQRQISLKIDSSLCGGESCETLFSFSSPVTIIRPLIIAVHGLWDDKTVWSQFTPLMTDQAFNIDPVDYSGSPSRSIISTDPFLPTSLLARLKQNSLGFQTNAASLISIIASKIKSFREGKNSLSIEVSAVRADFIAHSMGGNVVRALPLISDFSTPSTLNRGYVHKLITIGTPHLGTPLAKHLLSDQNPCIRELLAHKGKFAINSAVTSNGDLIGGAMGELEGNGTGLFVSPAIEALKQSGSSQVLQIPTAAIAGSMTTNQLAGLDTCVKCLSRLISQGGVCDFDALATHLTSADWTTFALDDHQSDAVVPLTSQLNGAVGLVCEGFIHSSGATLLGFKPPEELSGGSSSASATIQCHGATVPLTDAGSDSGAIAIAVVQLLDTPVSDPKFLLFP